MPTYKVDYSGQTTGAESGKRIFFERNLPVECAKDDLRHLGDHVEMITKQKTAVVEQSTKRQLEESFPAYEELMGAGYESYEDVQKATDKELLAIKGIGKATLKDIRNA